MEKKINNSDYVYCTHCVHAKELFKAIENDCLNPVSCWDCDPFNPEDSVPFLVRPCYEEAVVPDINVGDK